MRARHEILLRLRQLRARGDNGGLRLHDGGAILLGQHAVRLGDALRVTLRGEHVILGIVQTRDELRVRDRCEQLTLRDAVAGFRENGANITGRSGRNRHDFG